MREALRSTLNREHRMKATELLQKQHRDIEHLLERLKITAPGDDRTVREDLAKLLVAHTGIEEEIFYPAVHKAAPELTLAAIEEHGLADYELGRLLARKADADTRDAQIGVLEEIVLLHIRREENELFRAAARSSPSRRRWSRASARSTRRVTSSRSTVPSRRTRRISSPTAPGGRRRR